MTDNISITLTDWNRDHERLGFIRRQVFILEQQVPEELEWDEYDHECIHVLATDKQQQPVATARMTPDGHIGRMAVMPGWRNLGIGSRVLSTLLDYARDHDIRMLQLNSQTQVIPFYEKHGFVTDSEEFMDAGIPHRHMHYNW